MGKNVKNKEGRGPLACEKLQTFGSFLAKMDQLLLGFIGKITFVLRCVSTLLQKHLHELG